MGDNSTLRRDGTGRAVVVMWLWQFPSRRSILLALASILLWAATSAGAVRAAPTEPICGSSPLAGIPTPDRWPVLQPCVSVTGVVGADNVLSSNGAYWITVRLDADSAWVVPAEERNPSGSAVVWAKIYPSIYQPDRALRTGQRVRLVAPLVYDEYWGWHELVPVKAAEVLAEAPKVFPVSLTIDGIVLGDSVLYSIVLWNRGDVPLRDTYLAGSLPGGGIVEWVLPEVGARSGAGPFSYRVPRQEDMAVNAFAHWRAPEEGTLTTPRVTPAGP